MGGVLSRAGEGIIPGGWLCRVARGTAGVGWFQLLALPAFGEHRPVGSKYALVPVQAHLGCSLCWEIPAPLKGVLLRAPARGMLEQLVGEWKRSTRNPGGHGAQTFLGRLLGKKFSLGSGVTSRSAKGRSLGPVPTPGSAQLDH